MGCSISQMGLRMLKKNHLCTKTTRVFKCCIGQDLSNTKEGSQRGTEEEKKIENILKVNNEVADGNPTLVTIILRISRLNTPIKRGRLAEWTKTTKSNHVLRDPL